MLTGLVNATFGEGFIFGHSINEDSALVQVRHFANALLSCSSMVWVYILLGCLLIGSRSWASARKRTCSGTSSPRTSTCCSTRRCAVSPDLLPVPFAWVRFIANDSGMLFCFDKLFLCVHAGINQQLRAPCAFCAQLVLASAPPTDFLCVVLVLVWPRPAAGLAGACHPRQAGRVPPRRPHQQPDQERETPLLPEAVLLCRDLLRRASNRDQTSKRV